MIDRILEIIHTIICSLTNRCTECGGQIRDWDSKRGFCEDCGKEY